MKISPGWALLSAVVFFLAACMAATFIVLSQPWIGIGLAQNKKLNTLDVTSVAINGPSAGTIPVPSRLIELSSPEHNAVPLVADDLTEEPDHFDTYPEMAAFIAKQDALSKHLGSPSINITYQAPDGGQSTTVIKPGKRPLTDLPFEFWFQLFAAGGGFLIGCWVWVLRPRDFAARMFALTGAMLALSAISAAIYSSRELALDGTLFRVLTALNHAGSFLFGCALIALFMSYPKQLAPPRKLWWIPAIFVPWLVLDVARVAPDLDMGLRFPIAMELLIAIVAIAAQWRCTRDDPSSRAALRWFGLSVIIGCGLFVVITFGAASLDWFPPMRQSYSFGFFLIMYIGLALGLRRYRLFELDEWAFKVLMWVGGALVLIAFDAALILLLKLDSATSLGMALLVCGFIYFPIRNWAWEKVAMHPGMKEEEMFPAVLQIAFNADPLERHRMWKALLSDLFRPLDIVPLSGREVVQVEMRDDGSRLDIPAVAASPAMRLHFPWQGKGLFGPRHVKLVAELVELVRYADQSRDAYDRGVAEERQRIARDLHDDVGSHLLSALHQQQVEHAKQMIRAAIKETRTIVNGLYGRHPMLAAVLGDLRHETSQRLDEAGIALEWPLWNELPDHDGAMLPYRHYKSYVSVVRELISNVIRHAGATRASVAVQLKNGRLMTEIQDDGIGFDCASSPGGNGLNHIRQRINELGGSLHMSSEKGNTRFSFDFPVLTVSVAQAAVP